MEGKIHVFWNWIVAVDLFAPFERRGLHHLGNGLFLARRDTRPSPGSGPISPRFRFSSELSVSSSSRKAFSFLEAVSDLSTELGDVAWLVAPLGIQPLQHGPLLPLAS